MAWLAGLFEGEGSVSAVTRQHGGSPKLTLSIKMTDEDVLQRALEVAGVGRLYGPYRSSYPGAKPHWSFNVARSHEAHALLLALRPWLGRRRQAQIDEKVGAWLAHRDGRPLANSMRRKCTDEQLDEIWRRVQAGEAKAAVAAAYGIKPSTLSGYLRTMEVERGAA